LRYAENLKATEEEMIDHCWPETGKVSMIGMMKKMNWDRLRISRLPGGQKWKFQIARGQGVEISEDLTCQEDSQGISIFQ
jgi:hypothetical protein